MRSILFIFLVGVLSCASPQKNLEKGNFQKAYSGALSELEKGQRGKNKDILNRAFNEMLESHLTEYELLLRANDLEDLELAYGKRDRVIVDYLKGKRWLSDDFDAQMQNIETEQLDLQDELAETFLGFGNEAMHIYNMNGDKMAAQDAFGFYNKAEQYNLNNEELHQLVNRALLVGTIHILFEADAWDFSYEWDVDRIFKNIERESEGFYQVYFEDIIPHVDCRVEIDFNNLNMSRNRENDIREFTERIQDGYETIIDTTGKTRKEPKYIDIKGAVKIIREIRSYTWEARVKSDRVNNYCDFRSRNFETSFTTESLTYELSGDRRAIPNEYKSQPQDKFKGDEDDIVEDMIEDIYEQVVRYYF